MFVLVVCIYLSFSYQKLQYYRQKQQYFVKLFVFCKVIQCPLKDVNIESDSAELNESLSFSYSATIMTLLV